MRVAPGSGAVRLLAALPPEGGAPLCLDVLGPLRLRVGAEVRDCPQLRRARVRELLCALVVAGPLTRDRATVLVWPNLDGDRAAHNLRVTLTHLRRALDPDGGTAGRHLRVDGDRLALVRSPALRVDLWEFDRLLAEADRSRRGGDGTGTSAVLAQAVDLWRDDPLPDLARLPDLAAEADRVRLRYVEALLALGELRLTEGDATQAQVHAGRALAVDAYDLRAHRLALAAALHRRDSVRIRACGADLRRTLRALGLEPDRATDLLLRQAGGDAARRTVA